MVRQVIDRAAEHAVLAAMQGIRHGQLELHVPSGARTFGAGGGLSGTLAIRDRRFFRRVLLDGEIGLGESYMDGDWTTPDLVPLVRVMLQNRAALASVPAAANWLPRLRDAMAHRRRDNTRSGSRRNIHAHYDLGNEFFKLFLDPSLMYSCAVYERPDDTLEMGQAEKLRLICDKLQLRRGDHVLEIGTGWGGFALFAATNYGCRVTTTTISTEQHAYARDLIARSPKAAGRVDVRFEDYRDLTGVYDKIVSIEMFEAVGLRHYDDFFAACDRLLKPDGVMLLQTITVDDWRFGEYRSAPTWISKYIFPGAELASVAEILKSLARVTRLNMHHAQQIGTHYARTLHQWRERFHARLPEVRAQGFDERFIRMWDLYLAFCEAAFLERHCGDYQLVLAKAANKRVLFDEPWQQQLSQSFTQRTQSPMHGLAAP
jgi:cyclopropane-fatty-acyl-phospholipid synthase